MSDIEIINRAKGMLKPLLALNVIFALMVLLTKVVFDSPETATYFGVFFFIEIFLFAIFFAPVFIYNLIRGRGIRYSSSKAMLAFGDFYHYVSPW